MSQFRGQAMLVTGTSRGLGRALADQLEADGAHVIRHTRELGDLATPAGIAAVARQMPPRLDALIHNAAINPAPRETIDELSPETMRAVFAVNVEAPVFLTTALLGPLRAAGNAQVLAVSSEAGMFSHGMGPTGFSYRMSKAALNAFVLIASQALAPDIRVNAVHPGWVRTDMGGEAAPLSPEEAARDVIAALARPGTGRIYEAGREADW